MHSIARAPSRHEQELGAIRGSIGSGGAHLMIGATFRNQRQLTGKDLQRFRCPIVPDVPGRDEQDEGIQGKERKDRYKQRPQHSGNATLHETLLKTDRQRLGCKPNNETDAAWVHPQLIAVSSS
ncbi:hypothetical protein GCM10007285_01660 [Stappia taiwanensis]|nr:hypothetical protein GCM10007285_01660 [Stappia taiwanensis]